MDKRQFEKSLISLYHEYYKFEMDRKDKLNQYTNFPLTLISALFAFIGYLASAWPKRGQEIAYFIFIGMFILLMIGSGVSVTFMIRAIFGKTYGFLPTPADMESHYAGLDDFNATSKKKEDIEQNFSNWLRGEYASQVQLNSQSNDLKSLQILMTIKAVSISLIIALFTALPFFYLKFTRTSDPQEFKITNIGELKMGSSDKKPGPIKNTQQPAKKPPTPPPGRRIIESENKNKPKT